MILSRLKRPALAGLFAVFFAASGYAVAETTADYKIKTYEAAFSDAVVDTKNAVINGGFKIDLEGHFGDMLERTSKVVGKTANIPYKHAEYIQFCPSKLTHASVAANPKSIANCPIVIFVYELKSTPGRISVGYRRPMPGSTDAVRNANADLEKLLDAMLAEIAG